MALIDTWREGDNTIAEGTVEDMLALVTSVSVDSVWERDTTVYVNYTEGNAKHWQSSEILFDTDKDMWVFTSALDRLRGRVPYITNSMSWVPTPPRVGTVQVPLGTKVSFVRSTHVQVGKEVYELYDPKNVDRKSDRFSLVGGGLVNYTVDPGILVGRTILQVTGLKEGSDKVVIVTDAGTLTLGHEHDCCERIELLDCTGDSSDVAGKTVRSAKVTFGGKGEEETFYEIKTDGGDIWLRFGDANDDSRYGVDVAAVWEPAR
jgi:hypothetical protein